MKKPTIKIDSSGYISAAVSSEQDELVVFKFVQAMTLEQISRKNPAVAGIIKRIYHLNLGEINEI